MCILSFGYNCKWNLTFLKFQRQLEHISNAHFKLWLEISDSIDILISYGFNDNLKRQHVMNIINVTIVIIVIITTTRWNCVTLALYLQWGFLQPKCSKRRQRCQFFIWWSFWWSLWLWLEWWWLEDNHLVNCFIKLAGESCPW